MTTESIEIRHEYVLLIDVFTKCTVRNLESLISKVIRARRKRFEDRQSPVSDMNKYYRYDQTHKAFCLKNINIMLLII